MKQRGRMIIDIAMTVMLLCQMAYMLVGEDLHEWVGTAMFVLFIAHHVVNRRWYGNLFKGRYTPFRVMQVIVNVLLLLAMLGLMVSGIIMSRIVFDFLPIEGGTAFARTVHMLASYWGFILMSMHLGMHWGMVMGMVRKLRGENGANQASPSRTVVLRLLAAAISVYGVYAFLKHNIADYLFLRTYFVFFDFEETLLQFFVEYIAMMGLWACVAYYLMKLLQKCTAGRKRQIK